MQMKSQSYKSFEFVNKIVLFNICTSILILENTLGIYLLVDITLMY